jgi:ubiquinone/menaquinone biosynthesis C-methylase UbiE
MTKGFVDRKSTVQGGYNELAPHFGRWMATIDGEPSARFVGELTARLDNGARVLDLGCGDGTNARRLAERFDVVGVDLSEEQLRLARAAAPEATFVQADFAEVDFPAGGFDAVTAFYSLVHLPRADHSHLLAKVWRWLRPGGFFLASLSTVGGPDRIEKWLGVEMFFSGFDAETNSRLIREAGFETLIEEIVSMREPEGETAFLWVLAQRPE